MKNVLPVLRELKNQQTVYNIWEDFFWLIAEYFLSNQMTIICAL